MEASYPNRYTKLRSMIDTSNESWYNVWLTDEVDYEIWYEKNWETEIPKIDSRIFLQIISRFFSGMYW